MSNAMASLRKLVFWLHLAVGVIAGAVVLVMSVTGVALTYERQLIKWSDRGFRSEPEAGATRVPVERLVAELSRQSPGLTPTALSFSADPADPVTVNVERQTYYMNPYTGRFLGPAATGVRGTLSEIRSWHRWLAAEGAALRTARAVTGWANVLFLLLIVSGVFLWMPRRWSWTALRATTVLRPRLRGKARDFNWHNAIGVWSAVPLAIVVASAVPISFPWGTELVYRAVGDTPPAARGEAPRGRTPDTKATPPPVNTAGADALLNRAMQQETSWRTVSLRLPTAAEAPATFSIDRGDGGQPHLRSTLTLSRTGDVIAYETFAQQSPGRRMRSILRFAHTGEVLGAAGQTIAGLATAGSTVLVWTGMALALRRLVAWAKRRRAAAAAAPALKAAA